MAEDVRPGGRPARGRARERRQAPAGVVVPVLAGGRGAPLVRRVSPVAASRRNGWRGAALAAPQPPGNNRDTEINCATGCHSDNRSDGQGKRSMGDEKTGKDLEEKSKQTPSGKFYEQMISYNVSEAERPGGLKVRFKITVVTGKRAAALDARQAEAIRRLLEWTLQHRQETGSR